MHEARVDKSEKEINDHWDSLRSVQQACDEAPLQDSPLEGTPVSELTLKDEGIASSGGLTPEAGGAPMSSASTVHDVTDKTLGELGNPFKLWELPN